MTKKIIILFAVFFAFKLYSQVGFDNRNWVIGRYYGNITRKTPSISYTVTHWGGVDITKVVADTCHLEMQDSTWWSPSNWNSTPNMSGVLNVPNDSTLRYLNTIYGQLFANDSLHFDIYSGGAQPDYWSYRMVKYKSYYNVGINEILNLENKVFIYPNPCSDRFFISSIGFHEGSKVVLFSIEGKEIALKQTYQNEFDVSDLPEGMYFLKLQTKEGTLSRKIVITH